MAGVWVGLLPGLVVQHRNLPRWIEGFFWCYNCSPSAISKPNFNPDGYWVNQITQPWFPIGSPFMSRNDNFLSYITEFYINWRCEEVWRGPKKRTQVFGDMLVETIVGEISMIIWETSKAIFSHEYWFWRTKIAKHEGKEHAPIKYELIWNYVLLVIRQACRDQEIIIIAMWVAEKHEHHHELPNASKPSKSRS